jgi:HEAT repeat protein
MASSKTYLEYLGLFTQILQEDTDSLVRVQCAYYLGKFKHKDAVSALIKSAEDSNVFVRQESVRALGEIAETASLSILLNLLEHDINSEVRRLCAVALDKINSPLAIAGLIEQLDDINQSVSYAVLESLRKITQQDFGKDIKQWEKWKESQPTDK